MGEKLPKNGIAECRMEQESPYPEGPDSIRIHCEKRFVCCKRLQSERGERAVCWKEKKVKEGLTRDVLFVPFNRSLS